MNHNSKNYTLAFFVLVVAIIVGIVSLVVVSAVLGILIKSKEGAK